MGSRLRLVLGFWIGLSVGVAGCTDLPTPPDFAGDDATIAAPFFERAPALGFDVLKRATPLPGDLSAVVVIDEKGGWLRLEQAGISVYFPEGALISKTRVSLTAFAGDRVAFEFAPHGLTFTKPIQLRIDINDTEAEMTLAHLLTDNSAHDGLPRADFLGVYFEGRDRQGVQPLETFPVHLDEGDLVFETEHFSGYACASG